MNDYYIYQNNELINTIVSDEEFVKEYCESNHYTYKQVLETPDTNPVQDRIAELKQLLADSDYKAIKYAEGLIPEEEYISIREERQSWREEINSLESQAQ